MSPIVGISQATIMADTTLGQAGENSIEYSKDIATRETANPPSGATATAMDTSLATDTPVEDSDRISSDSEGSCTNEDGMYGARGDGLESESSTSDCGDAELQDLSRHNKTLQPFRDKGPSDCEKGSLCVRNSLLARNHIMYNWSTLIVSCL